MKDKQAPTIVRQDALRDGLIALNNRNPDGLHILAAATSVNKQKIKRYMEGDDSALTSMERSILELHQ